MCVEYLRREFYNGFATALLITKVSGIGIYLIFCCERFARNRYHQALVQLQFRHGISHYTAEAFTAKRASALNGPGNAPYARLIRIPLIRMSG